MIVLHWCIAQDCIKCKLQSDHEKVKLDVHAKKKKKRSQPARQLLKMNVRGGVTLVWNKSIKFKRCLSNCKGKSKRKNIYRRLFRCQQAVTKIHVLK